ncbi:hypothetical protein JCM3775_007170 [Rhodotorula graminis]|uniref:Centromere protein H C-terminal domain-containing protein n=1 Tax=Rhodotorula graminis (strain WP1) TaxID=578459 RepID=A0A0P9GZQ5_RHOGW|nr:uncharacterized protein RHOBADRAFT_55578 [Rhodotorula graminis WP1]KPV72913.1 hypothetical protein RHOBADRAFT_55578 [Rhodotorula graminis WP1]
MNSPPVSPLAAALSTNSHLRTQLAQAHTRLEQRERLRQLEDERTPDHSPDAIRSRERDLETRLASLQGQLARERAQDALQDGVQRALDQSHLVSTHLSSLSPSVLASPDQLALTTLLRRRDALSLSLLALTDKLSSLSSERALLRRDLLRLNRRNAQLVADLRAKHTLSDPAQQRAARQALPAPTAEYLTRLETELPILHTRLATLQSLVSRLIPECGLPAPSSSSSSPAAIAHSALSIPDRVARIEADLLAGPPATTSSSRVDERRPWSAQRTWDVLLLAGDDAGLERQDGGDGAPDPRWEREQALPALIVERAEAWERERAVAKEAGRSTPARADGFGLGGETPRKRDDAGKGRAAGDESAAVRSSASKGRSRTVG